MDVKLGGLLSQLAYTPDKQELKDQLPAGWHEVFRDGYPESGTQGAFIAYANSELPNPELVIAFKGTTESAEWFDDILNAGRTMIGNVVGRAEQALAAGGALAAFNGYAITTVGHSTGGGAAQTLALENDYDTYVYDSLPISSTVLQTVVTAHGPDASVDSVLADYRANHLAVEPYYGGEIAGTGFKTLATGTYLDTRATEVPSIANGLAAVATLVAASFGADAQALHPFSGLQDGFLKLA